MKALDVIFERGTQINKYNVWDLEEAFKNLGINFNDILDNCCGGVSDFIYISCGYKNMLLEGQKVEGEYHHYFLKNEEGDFICETYYF